MFHFFRYRKERQFLKGLKALEHMANKVLSYRKDLLSPEIVREIEAAKEALCFAREGWKPQEGMAILEKKANFLEKLLKSHGGKIYPSGFWTENIEMVVVAAFLAIGFRSFFLQPYKIPTNSMYPSFYGMTEVIYDNPAKAPGILERISRWALLGAENFRVNAETTGELVIALNPPGYNKNPGILSYSIVPSKAFFGLLPEQSREYRFWVNGKVSILQVPLEYTDVDDVFLKRYFPEASSYSELIDHAVEEGRIRPGKEGYRWFTGIPVTEGQAILDFDILSGDRLFVDRFTYNFCSPRVGDAIVFYTREIKGLAAPDGTPDDRFYIKRCVGLPGDVLEIRAPVLYRNGKMATGSPAFELNAEQKDLYPGYTNKGNLASGKKFTVPKDSYYVLGDNSPHSLDSRFWGTVPEQEVVGRALFIYYPFTKRWGFTK